jgi:hypothetical protein
MNKLLRGTKAIVPISLFTLSAITPFGQCRTTSTLTTFSFSDGPHIVYVDVNQHLNQMAYNGSAWYNQDVTALAGTNTLAASATGTALYSASDGPRIYYVDTKSTPERDRISRLKRLAQL